MSQHLGHRLPRGQQALDLDRSEVHGCRSAPTAYRLQHDGTVSLCHTAFRGEATDAVENSDPLDLQRPRRSDGCRHRRPPRQGGSHRWHLKQPGPAPTPTLQPRHNPALVGPRPAWAQVQRLCGVLAGRAGRGAKPRMPRALTNMDPTWVPASRRCAGRAKYRILATTGEQCVETARPRPTFTPGSEC